METASSQSWAGIITCLQLVPDELKLEKDTLDSYLASLRSASSGSAAITVDEVKALFSADGEAVDIDNEAEPAEDPRLADLMTVSEPKFSAATADELDLNEVKIELGG